MLESALVCRSDMGMATDIILTATDMGTIRTTTTDIRARWFTSGRDITGIGIIGAAVIAATFGTTASTGGKSKPV